MDGKEVYGLEVHKVIVKRKIAENAFENSEYIEKRKNIKNG